LLLSSSKIPEYVRELLVTKCNYVGFCSEGEAQMAKCGRVNRVVPGYNAEMHARINAARLMQMNSRM
jgi:hypothetical protein